MPISLPDQLANLIKQNPPDYPRGPKLDALLEGDLDSLIAAYAKAGCYHGKTGSRWKVWLALQEHKGTLLSKAILELSS